MRARVHGEEEVTETGFRVATFKEFKELGLSQLKPKPKVVFVNRRSAFKPPEDVLKRYTEFMRRYTGNPKQKEFSLNGSSYDRRYRQRLLNNNDSMKAMRNLSQQSRVRLVYMVTDKDRPDADIIVNICRQMIGGGVWK